MAHRRPVGLRKAVESSVIAGTVFGNMASSAFLILGIATGYAMGLTPLIFVLAGVIFFLTSQTYLEGMTSSTHAGGSSVFARRAFNDFWSFIAGWAVLLDYLIIVTMAAFFASHYLAQIPGFKWADGDVASSLVSTAMIAIVALVNLRRTFAKRGLTVYISLAAIITLGIIGSIGLVTVTDISDIKHNFSDNLVPGWYLLAFAVPIAMMGFTGMENAANLSEELRSRAELLRKPVYISIAAATFLMAGLSIVALSTNQVSETAALNATHDHSAVSSQFQRTPISVVTENLGLSSGVTDSLSVLVSILALLVLFLLANTGVAGMSRLVYSMSRHRQLPSVFSNIERDAGTPASAVLVFVMLALGLLLITKAINSSEIALAEIYAFGAMIGCTIAHAAIIRLRFTEPDIDRPFRAPLNFRFRNRDVPLTSLLGLFACAAIWITVVATHPSARAVGVIWMVAGFVGYGTYRFSHGLPLLRRADRREYHEITIEAPIYRQALVAIRPPDPGLLESEEIAAVWSELALDEELTALAGKILDIEDGQIAALAVHEIPLRLPLSVDLGRSDEVTAQRLGAIRNACSKLGVQLATTVARSRAAGRAICQEASRRDCDVIVLAAPNKRRPGDPVFGKTVEYVLRHADCDVAVLKIPVSVDSQQGRVDKS